MREIAIVISDLYLTSGDSAGPSSSTAAAPPLPGLQDVVRLGQRHALQDAGGWRSWLARLMGHDALAVAAPAAVAAATSESAASADSRGGTVWIATPVHLLAGLTSLHLDYRGLLQLSQEELLRLAQDFAHTFGDSQFQLSPTRSGALLLHSRDRVNAVTIDPTRALAGDLDASLPSGPGAAVLKRLGAEMEMWLHSHPINEARVRRGDLPVSTLWLWGGGPALAPEDLMSQPKDLMPQLAALGSDPFLAGLCRLGGVPLHPLPESLPDSTELPQAARLILVAQVTPLLLANPNWTMFDALAQIDRAFIGPAIAQLRRGSVTSVLVVANDHQLHVRRHDPLKFWRRRPSSAISALRSLG